MCCMTQDGCGNVLYETGMRKRLHFCGSGSTLKKEAGSELESILLFKELEAEAFFIKHAAGLWKQRKLEAVKFFWKRKHFEERGWKRKQTRKRLTSYGAGSWRKFYSSALTSMKGSNETSFLAILFSTA